MHEVCMMARMQDKNRPPGKKTIKITRPALVLGLACGTALGVGIGVAYDNPGVGVGSGILLGAVPAVVFSQSKST
jgi:hypothetical protein